MREKLKIGMKSDRKDMMDFDDFFLGKRKINLPARTIKGPLETCMLKMLCPNELHKCLDAAVLQKAHRL